MKTRYIKSPSLKRRFINDVYGGNYAEYKQARKRDYCKVQLEFTVYLENLYIDGIITEKQLYNIVF